MQEPSVFTRSDLTYNTYLKVDELLKLQQCQSQPVHHDEMLFIIIHQSYELWFKLILGELENAAAYMVENKVLRARHFIRRVVEIQKLLVSQIHILETMTPIEFLGFRDHLNPASGFQSLQFREFEFLAGLKDPSYFEHFEDQGALTALKRRLDEPDLWEHFQRLLGRLGFDVPEAVVRADSAESDRDRLFGALRQIYENPERYMDVYMLAEELVDLDTQLQLWRFHHVSVVERIIGGKRGTGGSSGVGYLHSTVSKKCFPLLWEVRSHLGGPGAASAAGCPYHHAKENA
ncbi:MAG TPA: tryptophan 2,3-dioxygenase family protein [Oscillatoriaceae cyanobacterium]